jgi:putative nucleotidyltransferase with HDIG domain
MYSFRSRAFIGIVIAAGVASLAHGCRTWTSTDPAKYLSYLLLALAAAGVKIRLPGVTITISLCFLFVLIGISEFSLGESVAMGCAAVVVQSFLLALNRPKPVQLAFNVARFAFAIDVCFAVQQRLHSGLITAAALFVCDSVPIALVIALTEHKNALQVWRDSFLWSFPNYLAGAAAVWLIGATEHRFGWQAGLLLLPILYTIYRSHRSYIDRLEEAKARAEREAAHALELAALHRRTIETLALAIEAKDQTTHDHLERVETCAIEIAKDLGMAGTELEALRAAALLHDVGKVAVPEYVIAKPGRLTPAEFEKMKTHTVMGAAIVERICFPYDVASLVRGHHEKWNGTGYPDGLSGERIPLGARILGAVDFLDAITSDRQYRRAMPIDEALALLKSESGKSFDPAVVEVLVRRHGELEAMVKSRDRIARFPVCVRVERGAAPAAGFETVAATRDLLSLRNATAGAAQSAADLAGLVASVTQCETHEALFGALRVSLPGVIPYDLMVVYLRRGDMLWPDYIDGRSYLDGEGVGLAGLAPIPIGEGLSGWVAEHGKAIVNGNPDVERGFESRALRSALAVPLRHDDGLTGVLSLYRKERDAFTNANLAALSATAAAIAGMCVPGGG